MTGRRVLVTGAGGFIGGHLVGRLLDDGEKVVAVDIKPLGQWHQVQVAGADISDRFQHLEADITNVPDFNAGDPSYLQRLGDYHFDEVYSLAADMGGMGFIETHKLSCMLTVLTTTNVLRAADAFDWKRVIYASSACVYPVYIQNDERNLAVDFVALSEDEAYPADPEDGYGWEKLFGERMHRHFSEDRNIETRVARLHNVYGPYGTWQGGREKAPAALCRKIATAKLTNAPAIEVWGDGTQLRSFCYVSDAVEGLLQIGRGHYPDPLNLGSSEVISVENLALLIANVADYPVDLVYVKGPLGVRGRSSDNTLIRNVLDWEPKTSLIDGITETYQWVEEQVRLELEMAGE